MTNGMRHGADEWLATRRSLLTRLRDAGDQTGWQEFFETYWKLLYRVARKSGLTDAEAQDAVQETIITVAQQMPEFCYEPPRCSFKGWLCCSRASASRTSSANATNRAARPVALITNAARERR